MTKLNIQTIDSSLVVDSRLVATELGIQHKNLKELLKTYQADFEGFGRVAFETETLETAGGIQQTSFYFLNEDQCYLLLTFVKNTPEARQAKINLVKAFKGAREKVIQPQLPNDYLTALKALVVAEEEKSQLALKAAAAESKVIEMAPKVELYNVICEAGQNVKVGDLARILSIKGLGQNNLFAFLRKHQVLFGQNIPYQKHINSGYFTCIQKTSYNGKVYTVTLVTPKGVEFIIGLLKEADYIIPSKAA
ncbi:MAG: phage regulatory protein/antirepressor Ant [Nostoc sp. CmiVER01]|uniref:phage regulatory protein/antirepressor Ant n=1 Tax=Nostoc sp. CmiVER01 TaxID=3075384 RepID=UPI002AD49384|nr:phage regulatory protein/antirepressor Ant [Nostoc sp. CmiVER01]MDZ8124744.1 phage regulatory protein/antirepressor Ant [Nostoc sp. CmiVER01]